jgi:phage baseplate assembly protein V
VSDHAIRGALDRIGRRVMTIVAGGRKTTGRDDGNVQLLQARLGEAEVRDDLPRLAEFGFASMPPDGSDLVVLFVGGDRSNGVVIASGHIATRMKNLQPGESALYDSLGKHVYLKADQIEIDAKGQPVNVINASQVNVTSSGPVVVTAGGGAKIIGNTEIDGTLYVTQNITSGADVLASGISLHNHLHGGVKGGGENTGAPE